LIIEGKSKVFTVKPGRTNYTYNDFSGAEVKYNNGKYKEIILRTGNAPEGSYTICVTAFEESGEIAGMENCITQTVQQMGSITLILPENGAELDPDTLPGLVFSWTPLPKGGPYSLRIVELKGDQSPDVAIKENRPILDVDGIKTTTYHVAPSQVKVIVMGMKYAWQVTSGDVVSEVSFFAKEDRIWDMDDDIQNENGWLELADTIYYKPRPGHRHWWSGRRWDTLIVNSPSDESVEEHKPRPGHKHWWSGKRWDTLIVHTENVDENPEAMSSGWAWDSLMITSPVDTENSTSENVFFTFTRNGSTGLHQKSMSKYFILLENSQLQGDAQNTTEVLNKEFLVLQSKSNTELEYAYLMFDSSRGLVHKYKWSNNDPRNPNSMFIQSDLDNLDFSKITLQAIDGEEMGLKFVHAYADSTHSVSSWILPVKSTLNDEKQLEEQLKVHRRVWSWIHSRDKTECDRVPKNRKIRLIDNSTSNRESIVTYELKDNGTYGFKIFNNMISQEELDAIHYTEIILLDLDKGIMRKHCYLYTKCDGPTKPKK